MEFYSGACKLEPAKPLPRWFFPDLRARRDLLLLNGSWYVTTAGLLRIARREECAGIHVRPVLQFCDPSSDRRQRELGAFLISCNTKYSM